eukprot:scaffold2.g7435.t1
MFKACQVTAAHIPPHHPRAFRHVRLNRLVNGNLRLFRGEQRAQLRALASGSRRFLLRGWPAPGVADEQKRLLVSLAAAGASGGEVEAARLQVLQPPRAERHVKLLETHGDVREDAYYWLRDDEREDPAVLAYLQQENAYTKAVLADTEDLQAELYREMRGRIQEADQSTPVRRGAFVQCSAPIAQFEGWYYYTRTLEGQQYAVHCRRAVPAAAGPPSEADIMDESVPGAPLLPPPSPPVSECCDALAIAALEEVLLDENEAAKKHEFYMVAGQLLAWGEDTVGGEKFTLHVKDLASGARLLARPIPDTAGDVAWANDNAALFYVTKDKLDRPFKVWRHSIGTDPSQDVLVYHEEDESFYIGLGRSRSEQLLYIHAGARAAGRGQAQHSMEGEGEGGSAVTSEVRYVRADEPAAEWTVVRPRESEVEYSAAHRGDHLFLTLRDTARPNSELLVAPLSDPSATTTLLPHRDDVKLEHVEVCKDFLVTFERINGLQQAIVYKLDGPGAPAALGGGAPIAFEEAAYELSAGAQGDWESPVLRLHYTSLRTPDTVLDYNMASGQRAVKKVQPVLGGFDPERYKTERLWAAAPDGVKVPISLVYRSDLVRLDGSAPMLLDAYGSYEVSNDPDFRSTRLSLVDRGFVFAIAHVRGGGEMGRRWYETGKYLQKKNTFMDFIACAEHLIAECYTSPARLCIEGRSAGGLTMGASLNMRPDLFSAAILGVPFVDCLTTMLDETIPLTTIEWEEWGNPADPQYYEYMRSYSPVDNVKPQAYPNVLITAGLHDPRVGYWEPAKFAACLREAKTDRNLLLLKVDLGAGHFSKSGRFDRLHEVAVEWAFLLKVQGMLDVPLQPSGLAEAAAAAAAAAGA